MSNKAPSIKKTTYDFGVALMANLPTCGLPLEVQEYYLVHKDRIPEAFHRGFVLPKPELQQAVPITAPSALFKADDTDLNVMLHNAQKYAKTHFGTTVDLRAMFDLPAELPWKNVLPVFDPGKLTNRDAVKALQGQGLKVWEETDVMNYGGSEASETLTLHLIENSIRPMADTMGLSPNQLRQTGKPFLRLRGYALAFGLRHFVSNDFLDSETFTWFPEGRLSDGNVAYGGWDPDGRKVEFYWLGPGYKRSYSGARAAIPVSLKP